MNLNLTVKQSNGLVRELLEEMTDSELIKVSKTVNSLLGIKSSPKFKLELKKFKDTVQDIVTEAAPILSSRARKDISVFLDPHLANLILNSTARLSSLFPVKAVKINTVPRFNDEG
jgi:hypothetical protein